MKLKPFLEQKYAQLCQKKGDLISQREKLDSLLEQINQEIEALNRAAALAPEFDQIGTLSNKITNLKSSEGESRD